jgi:hypothetical protein
MDCSGLLVSSGQLGMGHLFSCPRCIGDSKGLTLGLVLLWLCSYQSIDLSLVFFQLAWHPAFVPAFSGEFRIVTAPQLIFHNLGKVLRTKRPPFFFELFTYLSQPNRPP